MDSRDRRRHRQPLDARQPFRRAANWLRQGILPKTSAGQQQLGHAADNTSSTGSGGTRPPIRGGSSCRFVTTTGSRISAAARRTSSRSSISPANAASPTRNSTRAFRGSPRICATALKVARGDRVAVLALNTTDTLEVQFACGRIGAVFLPLNTRLTVPELHFIVGDAAPKLMIHDADLAETALSVAKLCNVALDAAARARRLLRGRDRGRKAARRVPRSSRSMTSRPSCTPRARPASRRARSSPTA